MSHGLCFTETVLMRGKEMWQIARYQIFDIQKIVRSLERTQLEMSSFPEIENYDFASFSFTSPLNISFIKHIAYKSGV